ncbi:hypothetical protein D3C72_1776040 [compost metagenome]
MRRTARHPPRGPRTPGPAHPAPTRRLPGSGNARVHCIDSASRRSTRPAACFPQPWCASTSPAGCGDRTCGPGSVPARCPCRRNSPCPAPRTSRHTARPCGPRRQSDLRCRPARRRKESRRLRWWSGPARRQASRCPTAFPSTARPCRWRGTPGSHTGNPAGGSPVARRRS